MLRTLVHSNSFQFFFLQRNVLWDETNLQINILLPVNSQSFKKKKDRWIFFSQLQSVHFLCACLEHSIWLSGVLHIGRSWRNWMKYLALIWCRIVALEPTDFFFFFFHSLSVSIAETLNPMTHICVIFSLHHAKYRKSF